MEPYPSRQFGFSDDPDHQFGNGSVWTRTRTRCDGPEPLLTLGTADDIHFADDSSLLSELHSEDEH